MVGPDDLTNAVGLNSASFNVARIVGPALAGLLIAALGSGVPATGSVILVNAVSYGAVILSLQRMRDSELQPRRRRRRGQGDDPRRRALRARPARPDADPQIVFFAGTFGLNFQMTSALMATRSSTRAPASTACSARPWRSARWPARCSPPAAAGSGSAW